jgi:polysaccharide export outer membrane protein
VTFEPNLRIPTPKNYILGPDDELVVDIYGNAVDNFRMKISPEGTVKMLNLAPVYVNGLTIEQASERIINRLGRLILHLTDRDQEHIQPLHWAM